jgi:hypothetical protein
MTPENVKDLGYPAECFKENKLEKIDAVEVVAVPGTLPEKPKEAEAKNFSGIDTLAKLGPKDTKPEKLFPVPEITLTPRERDKIKEQARKEVDEEMAKKRSRRPKKKDKSDD